MKRREFLALGPAFPAVTVSAALLVKEEGQPPVEAPVSVLKAEPGDVMVLRVPGPISMEVAERIRCAVESNFPGIRVMVLSDGMSVEGVLRGLPA